MAQRLYDLRWRDGLVSAQRPKKARVGNWRDGHCKMVKGPPWAVLGQRRYTMACPPTDRSQLYEHTWTCGVRL